MSEPRYFDCAVRWNGHYFPAWSREDGTLIDLRLFGEGQSDAYGFLGGELEFQPSKLRELGIPEEILAAASQSKPPGFVLLS
jgi:hypothetical protein